MSGGFEYGGGGGYGGGGYGGGGDSYSGMDAMTGNNYGGGGFMDEGNNSASKTADKKASRDSQSLLPVSIKQLNSSTMEDDISKIDGADLHTVVIMGMVESVEEHSTNVNFRINDGTGAVEGKLWNDKDSSGGQTSKISRCRENTFVKVVGQLREYEGKKHVLIYDISPVVDWNELTHHLFQVILMHLQNTKGPIPGTGPASKGQGQNMGSPSFNGGNMNNGQQQGQFYNQNHGQNQGQGQNMRGGQPMGMGIKDEHNSMKNRIKQVFDTGSYNHSIGLGIREIFISLQQNGMQNINERAIRDVCMEMTDDGIIYSTIDEDHFLAT